MSFGPPEPSRRRAGAVVAALLLTVACSSDRSDAALDAPSGPDDTSTVAAPEIPEVPPSGDPGTGTVVLGGAVAPFTVSSCRLEADPSQPAAARALVELTGKGTTAQGTGFTVELSRFATTVNDVVTYTDNVSYTDSARILQAQRIEVGGQVTDLRDADAATPLIRTRPDGVSAAGLAGAPGDGPDDEGIIGLALNATC